MVGLRDVYSYCRASRHLAILLTARQVCDPEGLPVTQGGKAICSGSIHPSSPFLSFVLYNVLSLADCVCLYFWGDEELV